jgi:ATP-dependent Clp protease ATP-binding subunit ClpC
VRVKDELLAATHEPAFWESDGRADVLGRIEYVDRLTAASRTAERMAERLQAASRGGRTPAAELSQLLASRLYVLDRACAELQAGEPSDALLTITPSTTRADLDEAAAEFANEIAAMYTAWADRRGMTVRRQGGAGRGERYEVSGLAAHAILRDEDGLHVLETPTASREFRRAGVRVNVVRIPVASAGDAPVADSHRDEAEIVRRYRRSPSPLVRDRRGWRTGRVDRVLAGDFDLFT